MDKTLAASTPISPEGDCADAASRLAEKSAAATPLIQNAADYVDALIRPDSRHSVVKKKVIAGRRMRDKLRSEEVVVTEVVRPPG
jgi:hypothetical protein